MVLIKKNLLEKSWIKNILINEKDCKMFEIKKRKLSNDTKLKNVYEIK